MSLVDLGAAELILPPLTSPPAAQIVEALAAEMGWALLDEQGRHQRAKQWQLAASQRERRVALEQKIQELYGKQLPKSAFRWTAGKVHGRIRVRYCVDNRWCIAVFLREWKARY